MTNTTPKQNQRINQPGEIGAYSLGGFNTVYGATATVLTRPASQAASPIAVEPKTLYLSVESGSFRIQCGDTHLTLATTPPSANETDGAASLKLIPYAIPYAFTAPDTVTVVGASGTDILTYWWL